MPGKFITFEGAEGVGKTTNIKLFAEYLKSKGVPYYLTREPGGTPLAEQLRNIALHTAEETVDPITELLVMFAARRQHICEVILPKIEAGVWVLCDRFTDSTYAYQVGGRGLEKSYVDTLKQMVQGELSPDKTFLFHCPPEISKQRVSQRGKLDRIEQEADVFFMNVREYFMRLASEEPGRFISISTYASLDSIQSQLSTHIDQLLEG